MSSQGQGEFNMATIRLVGSRRGRESSKFGTSQSLTNIIVHGITRPIERKFLEHHHKKSRVGQEDSPPL